MCESKIGVVVVSGRALIGPAESSCPPTTWSKSGSFNPHLCEEGGKSVESCILVQLYAQLVLKGRRSRDCSSCCVVRSFILFVIVVEGNGIHGSNPSVACLFATVELKWSFLHDHCVMCWRSMGWGVAVQGTCVCFDKSAFSARAHNAECGK